MEKVQVQGDQGQPQGGGMLVLISLDGARRDLEAAEVGAQETRSLLSTPPT